MAQKIGVAQGSGVGRISQNFNYKAAHTLDSFQKQTPPLPLPLAIYNDLRQQKDSICCANFSGQPRQIGLFYQRERQPGANSSDPLVHRLIKKWNLPIGGVVVHQVNTPFLIRVSCNDQQSSFTSGDIWYNTYMTDCLSGQSIVAVPPSTTVGTGQRFDVEFAQNSTLDPNGLYAENRVSNSTLKITVSLIQENLTYQELQANLQRGGNINHIDLDTFEVLHGDKVFYNYREKFLICDLIRYKAGNLAQEDACIRDITRGCYVVVLKRSRENVTFTSLETAAEITVPESLTPTGNYSY